MLKSANCLLLITLSVLLFQLPLNVCASAYWLQIKGNGQINTPVKIEICYGSIDEFGVRQRDQGKELQLTGGFKFYVLSANNIRQEIGITKSKDCWEGAFLPKQNGIYHIVGINDSHPVIDRSKIGGINEKPVDYLCTDYVVGLGDQTNFSLQYIDMIVRPEGKKRIIYAYKNSMPATEGIKLRVFNPENWEKELPLNENGQATFVPTLKGLYIIRQDLIEKTPGIYQGVPYADVRYRCNYCLQF